MNKSITIAAAALALAVLAWLVLGYANRPFVAQAPAPEPPRAGAAEPARRDLDPARASTREAVVVTDSADAGESATSSRGRDVVELVVEVLRDAAPCRDATVEVLVDAEPEYELTAIEGRWTPTRTERTDADGLARFDGVPQGRCDVRAELRVAAGESLRAVGSVVVSADGARLRLELGAAAQIVVRVIDGDRRPVADAHVELTAGLRRASETGEGTSQLAGRTDAAGETRFEDRDYAALIVVAYAPNDFMGTATVWTRPAVMGVLRTGALEVSVGPPARLHGRVRGLALDRLDGVRVVARLATNFNPHYTTHFREFSTAVVDGFYAFDALASGTYGLALIDPRGARLVLTPLDYGGALENSITPFQVALQPGASVALDLLAEIGATLTGRVVDGEGRAVASALVRATYAPRTSNFPDGFVLRGAHVWRLDSPGSGNDDHPDSHWRTLTDRDGRYRLPGLPAGRVRVEVAAIGLTYERREGVQTFAGEVTELEHVLLPAGAIRGIARRGGYLGVRAPGLEPARMLAVLPRDGTFCFSGLEAGEWELVHYHSNTSVEPVPALTVRVVAGETTFVDLDRESQAPIVIAGRVMDEHGPVVGANVTVHPEAFVTDSAGRFEARVAFPHVYSVSFRVAHEGITTAYEFEGMARDQREWRGDLVLGTESLTLRTLDADGRPSEAEVALSLVDFDLDGVKAIGGSGLAVDARGERIVRHLAVGEAHVQARFPDGSTRAAIVPIPAASPVELRAPASGTVVVVLRDSQGAPAVDFQVGAGTWTGAGIAPEGAAGFDEHAAWQWGTSDAQGRVELRGVGSGEILIVVADTRDVLRTDPPTLPKVRRSLARGERVSLELVAER